MHGLCFFIGIRYALDGCLIVSFGQFSRSFKRNAQYRARGSGKIQLRTVNAKLYSAIRSHLHIGSVVSITLLQLVNIRSVILLSHLYAVW